MNVEKKTHWIISIISLISFVLTFFILFRETDELFSSFFAAVCGALLMLATLIIGSWLIKVFTK